MSSYDDKIVNNEKRSRQIARFVGGLLDKDESPGIIFVRTHKHGVQILAACQKELGYRPELVSSKMQRKNRQALAKKMRRQDPEHRLVVSLPVWGTGLDIPCLSWVLLAAEGSAPVGLKQHAGRPTRACDGKPGFKIYDWVTMGRGLERYVEHAEKREAHYRSCGYEVAGPMEAAGRGDADSDVRLVGQLHADPMPLSKLGAQTTLDEPVYYGGDGLGGQLLALIGVTLPAWIILIPLLAFFHWLGSR